METIQLAIGNAAYAAALGDLLARTAGSKVEVVDRPDLCFEGVIVLDSEALDSLPEGIPNPERLVVVTKNDPRVLSKAWEAGVVSVVFENDPLNTVLLAIMAARLKAGKTGRQEPAPEREPDRASR
jgi:hypothetical protein